MTYETDKIKQALRAALAAADVEPAEINAAIFHLTDWLEDLNRWQAFCADPEAVSAKEVQALMMSFLVHVPAHLAAASKIITGLPVADVFGLGATSEELT